MRQITKLNAASTPQRPGSRTQHALFERPLTWKCSQREPNQQHSISIFWYNSQILSLTLIFSTATALFLQNSTPIALTDDLTRMPFSFLNLNKDKRQ
jgi:hypothetical protein